MLYRQVRQAPPPLQGCWEMRGGCAPLWVSPPGGWARPGAGRGVGNVLPRFSPHRQLPRSNEMINAKVFWKVMRLTAKINYQNKLLFYVR